ncbi:OmpL47-type beta-barrel domain-containing protein [Gorillibacterium massiliense]|uniref:OmpL47-type beta-barrel domain-containing protein n=1 Tax=Gorillibacterium massiliense TaxID=1280390 RepID=UPI0004B3E315|nr:sugar-binding protein [Gorillibacterium massiliense]
MSFFFEDFSVGSGKWDGTAWSMSADPDIGSQVGMLTSSGSAYPTVRAKPAAWADFAANDRDYDFRFKAKYTDAPSGTPSYFRALFRYLTPSAAVNDYYFEFRQIGRLVYFGKYVNGVDTRVGSSYPILSVLPNFDFSQWHSYKIKVNGSRFQLYVDEFLIADIPEDSTHLEGTIGFGLKNATLLVDNIQVDPYQVEPTITHVPLTQAYYNTDVSGSFTVTDGVEPYSAFVYYRYGAEASEIALPVPAADGVFAFTIPGTNRYSSISYRIQVEQTDGTIIRYPALGFATFPVRPFLQYTENFEDDSEGSIPANWVARGVAPQISVYSDEGNHVLCFANSRTGDNWSLKFVHPYYRNLDNFRITLRARYQLTNADPNEVYNLWRLRYRCSDSPVSYCTMEWGTHNSKYIMFKRTALGGFTNGSYFSSRLDEWHTYTVEVSGIIHRLFIDGTKVIEFDDFSADAPQKGYIQFDTVNGLELRLDDLEIAPVPITYTAYFKPHLDFAGVYALDQAVGVDAVLIGGSAAQTFRVKCSVFKADGDLSLALEDERTFTVAAYEKLETAILFAPEALGLGTYRVATQLYADDIKQDGQDRSFPIAIVKTFADTSRELDLDNESNFGFNVGYDPTWDEDMLRAVGQMGVRTARKSVGWSDIDKPAGVYDYTSFDALAAKFAGYGIKLIPIMGIGFHSGYDASGTVDTPAGLKALESFAQNLATHYKGSIRQWEMPNEPELEMHPYIPQEMVQLQKFFYVGLKEADLDASLLAGDHTSGVAGVLPGELDLGSYAYADAFSYHRYTYGVMPDGFIQNQTASVKSLINEMGGWKDFYVTEAGWPTALSGYPNVSQEVQRDYAVRGFLIDRTTDQMAMLEHFTWNDAGFDSQFYNTSFGVTDGLGRPKLAYAALTTLMTTLADALYAGKVDTGDSSVEDHVFLAQSDVVMAVWKKVNYGSTPVALAPVSQVSLPVYSAAGPIVLIRGDGSENELTVTAGTVEWTIGGSPVYLKGFGMGLLYVAALNLLNEKKNDAVQKMAASGDSDTTVPLIAEMADIHDRLTQSLNETLLEDKAAHLEQAIKDVFQLMRTAAGMIGTGALSKNPAFVALEALYNYAERAAASLIAIKQEQQLSMVSLDYLEWLGITGSTDSLTAWYSYEQKKGRFGLLPVSTSAMMRASRFGRIAEKAAAENRPAKSYGYNLLAREFAKTIPSIVASEEGISTEVMVSATPLQSEIEAGGELALEVTFYNRSDQAITVQILWDLPTDWDTVQTEALQQDVSLDANTYITRTFTLHAPLVAAKGIFYASMSLMLNGKQLDLVRVRLILKDAISFRLMPVLVPITELNEVTVRLTGTSSSPKSGRVVLKGPDGVLLEPVQPGGADFTLSAGESLDIPFHWTFQECKPFNEYRCQVDVLETPGDRLLFRDHDLPLDFLIVQRARTTMAIDGDLQDWVDAFPIHLRGAERNATGVYNKNDLDATAYLKWDDDQLYLAVDVTDDIHKASEPASSIWKNDSIQVAIDPLNNKGSSYKADDVDFGLALNDFGEKLGYVFAATAPNATGDISDTIPFAIVRHEAEHRTIYEASIPGDSIVHDLQGRLVLGGIIGFNIVVGDADYQEGRQNYTGWTKGIADSKNPGLFDSFTFVDCDFQLPDQTPPVSLLTVQGTAVNGWYATPVTVVLGASDVESGIAATHYRLGSGEWLVYGGAFSLTADGIYVIDYYSADQAGNEEAIRSTELKIDQTAPLVTLPANLVFRQIDPIVIPFSANDPLSGVAVVAGNFRGLPFGASPVQFDPLQLAPGSYVLTITAADNAGNETSVNAAVQVTVTLDMLPDIIQAGADKGWITSSVILKKLLNKAREANRKYPNRFAVKLALLTIRVIVQFERGKHIQSAFANLLIADIDYLLQHLPS